MANIAKTINQSALVELRSTLPHGDTGRIINSFIFHLHPDAEEFQRRFRQSLYDTKSLTSPFIIGDIYSYEQNDDDEEDTSVYRDIKHIRSGGWAMLELCKDCHCTLRFSVCHEAKGVNMNLQLQNATMQIGDVDIGFTLDIDTCDC